MLISISLIVAAFVVGFFVGHNNPNLAAVNRLITAKKAIITATGAIVKVIKR